MSVSRMDAGEMVRTCEASSHVERVWRRLKTIDLHIRPVHSRVPNRLRSHILLGLLAHYAEWHKPEAWRPLLCADEDQSARATRDPVAPAACSPAVGHKAVTQIKATHRISPTRLTDQSTASNAVALQPDSARRPRLPALCPPSSWQRIQQSVAPSPGCRARSPHRAP